MSEMASPMAAEQERGPIGNTRSIGLSILWAVLVIFILISPVTYFVVASETRYMYEDLDGQKSPVRGITGLWFILPLIGSIVWFVKVQGALNRYWQSKGAPPP